MQVLAAKYGLFFPLILLVISKQITFSKSVMIALNSFVLIIFIAIFVFAKQKFFYTLGIEQNIFFIYMIILASFVAISVSQEKHELLGFYSCTFLIAAFFVNDVTIVFPLVRMFIDYILFQHEKIDIRRANMFLYRFMASICEIALLYLVTNFEFAPKAAQILSLAIFFMFVFQMMLAYFFEKCFHETFTPIRIAGNFVNYFLYPGWALMIMRQVKCAETLTSLSVLVLILAVFVIVLDVYFGKKTLYALLVVNILIFFCPIRGNEYIFYKLSSYSFMIGLFLIWTEGALSMSTPVSRTASFLRYIFALLIALPILGNGNLTKFIILLKLHSEHLVIYLVILACFMALQAFYRSDTLKPRAKGLIKNFQPFWIIIVTNILVIIALNLSLLVNAKI
ncbi:MAG: hypothetical protein HYV97_13620 [Bdellovibrio sp.]|nr:hypothetical protein [Bdellovibrio sp.]